MRAMSLIWAIPAILVFFASLSQAELELRNIQFLACSESAGLSCLENGARDANYARIETESRDGVTSMHHFERWLQADGRRSYEVNILTEEMNFSEESAFAFVPQLQALSSLDPEAAQDVREVLIAEKERNSSGIIRVKWIAFDWSSVEEVQIPATNSESTEISFQVPMYFSVLYGPENNPLTLRVLGYLDYREGSNSGSGLSAPQFRVEAVVPEVTGAGSSSEQAGDLLQALFSAIVEADQNGSAEVSVEALEASQWEPSQRDIDLAIGVVQPILTLEFQLNPVFHEFVQERLQVDSPLQ